VATDPHKTVRYAILFAVDGAMLLRYGPLAGYIATIFLANLSLQYLGWCAPGGPCVVPVWPGLVAPSGVLWAGLAFTLRDLVQEEHGRLWTVVAIVVGAGLSALVSPQFAAASGLAFLLSELADFAVYTPLRRRNWIAAVALSNSVGLVADSVLFLSLAFGSLDFLAGQIVGKLWMTLLAVILLWTWRQRWAPASVAVNAPRR
jgi:queuosine precursor transporter